MAQRLLRSCAIVVALLLTICLTNLPARCDEPPAAPQYTDEQQSRLAEARASKIKADELYDAGRYAESLKLAQAVAETRAAILGTSHPNYGACLNIMALSYERLGDYSRAEPLFKQAAEIYKQAFGETHPQYATSLTCLAGLYRRMGDYARAEPLLKQAAEIDRNQLGQSHPDYAIDLDNLATLYRVAGDYAQAEPLYKQAAEIYKQALGEAHPNYAASLNNLALLYRSMGDKARAGPLYERALEIRRKTLGESHPDYVTSLNNLALQYCEMGDYARAETLHKQVLESRKRILGESHPDYATSLNNLAWLYYCMGDSERAAPLYRQALAIRKQALGEAHPEYAQSLNNLAWLYDNARNYEQAAPLYMQALEIKKKSLGPSHPDYATTLNNLALVELGRGRAAEAEALLADAVQITRKSLDFSAAVQSEQQQLTMAVAVRGYLDNYLTTALAVHESPSKMYAEVAAWKGSISAQQQLLRVRQRALAHDAASETSRLFAELDRQSRRLATLVRATPAPADAAKTQVETHTLSESVDSLYQQLSRLDPDFHRAWAERTISTAELQNTLPPSAALIDLLEYGHYLPSAEPGKKHGWQRRVLAFVVRRQESVVCIELGASAPIAELVEAWRSGFGQRATSQGTLPGDELRRRVWEPFEPHLAGIDTVLISPDGVLAQLAWCALPGRAPGSYLIEDRATAMIAIPQLLPELLKSTSATVAPASLLVAGDIDYGGDPGEPDDAIPVGRAAGAKLGQRAMLNMLPAAAAELDSIRNSYLRADGHGTIDVLNGRAATEAAFRRQAPHHGWLHLITHGYFAPSTVNESPPIHSGLLSGLALAGANSPPADDRDDGILTALEVAGLDLSRVDTVVLSACETGLGTAAGGEGLLGLQRAFQTAGAKTVIATLWKVPDAATSQLMRRFYENLWDRRMGKLAALREAQLWLIHHPPSDDAGARGLALDGRQAQAATGIAPPFFWAAFVLSGDWR
ncbi:MAG TPA: tetratricopeptide repeat protein [Pirellulales bacterium]|nr:tetratricopeptide repeat protein [Pirellulales bacterium]